jgi:hypothetical protein
MSRTEPVAIVVPVAVVPVATEAVPAGADAPTIVGDMVDDIVVGVVVTGIIIADFGMPIHGGLLVRPPLSELVHPMQAVVATILVTCVWPIGVTAVLTTGVACDMKAVTK